MSKVIKRDDLSEQIKVRELSDARKSLFLPSRGVISHRVIDAAEQAKALLQEARDEAEQVREQAKSMLAGIEGQVEEERKKGYDKGYDEGLAQVTELMTQATEQREKMLQEAEPEILRMVFQIAEKILGDAVERGAIVSVVQQALAEAIGERITVRVNPEDLEAVRTAEPKLIKRLQNIKSLTTVADETIERGGCAVDTEVGTIDAQLSTQLAAIKRSLGLTD